MKNLLGLLTLGALMLRCISVQAQDNVNKKFGKPTKQELEMTVYDDDPSAEAVVLCRLTNVEYTVQTNGYLVDYHEKVRIKVLKPSGTRLAHFVIPYSMDNEEKSNIRSSKFSLRSSSIEMGSVNSYFEGQAGSMTEDALGNYTSESVDDLKAIAFNLENGKTVKSSLKRSSVEKEKIDDQHYQVKFTVPDVKVGTVIEVEYCLHSELFWLMHDWYAQREIPVVYAELDMDIPSYLIYNIEEHGIQRLVCKCVPGTMHYKLESDAIAKPVSISTNHYTCIGRNLKAIHKDQYVWNEKDYCAGITGELKSYSLRGTMSTDYARTWEQIDSMIMSDEDLGKHLDDVSPLIEELKEMKIADISNENERAAEVCKLVFSKVKWNGRYELWPGNVQEILNKKVGNNADINLLLIQSLRGVGLTASPVVLRTRSEGLMPYNFPTLQKLNTYVVAITMANGKNIYVDASSANGYLNVLPENLLVERARVVMKNKKGQTVNLQTLQKSQTTSIIDATLTTDGKLSGKEIVRYEGLAAQKYRNEKGASEFAKEAREEKDFIVQGEVKDGKIIICPFPTPLLKDNPLKTDDRQIPIEFPCLASRQIILNITLPEGYTMETEPKSTIVTTQDKGVDVRYVTQSSDGKVMVKYQFTNNKIVQPEKNNKDLCQIYDIISGFNNTSIVFKK